METLLTKEDVVKRLQISVSGLYDMMARGDFPRPLRVGKKLRRWRESAVDEWMRELPESDPSEWMN